jgi:uncharacterized membrane protein HdeD (DUF308 family)
VALAVPAIAAATVTTFSSGHSAEFGLIVLGGFALLTAAAAAIGASLVPRGRERSASLLKVVVGVLAAVAVVLLLLLVGPEPVARATALSLTLAVTFILFGVIDLTTGLRVRRTDRFGRDWLTLGVIELVAALAMMIVPPTFFQAFSFTEKSGEIVSGAVTSSTMIVGLFGATGAIIGVFLVIAGIGLVPQRGPRGQREHHEEAAA